MEGPAKCVFLRFCGSDDPERAKATIAIKNLNKNFPNCLTRFGSLSSLSRPASL